MGVTNLPSAQRGSTGLSWAEGESHRNDVQKGVRSLNTFQMLQQQQCLNGGVGSQAEK